MGDDNVEALNYDNLEAVAHLQTSERYNSIMQVECNTWTGTSLSACMHLQALAGCQLCVPTAGT